MTTITTAYHTISTPITLDNAIENTQFILNNHEKDILQYSNRILAITNLYQCTSQCISITSATNSIGNLIIAWVDSNLNNIYAILYDTNNNPLSGILTINSIHSGNFVIVSALANNNFIFIWTSDKINIYGMILGFNGQYVTNDIEITTTLSTKTSLQVIPLTNQFIVIWTSVVTNNIANIFYRVFNNLGVSLESIDIQIMNTGYINAISATSIGDTRFAIAYCGKSTGSSTILTGTNMTTTTIADTTNSVPINLIIIDIGTINSQGNTYTTTIYTTSTSTYLELRMLYNGNFILLWGDLTQVTLAISSAIINGLLPTQIIYTNPNFLNIPYLPTLTTSVSQSLFAIAWISTNYILTIQFFQVNLQETTTNIYVYPFNPSTSTGTSSSQKQYFNMNFLPNDNLALIWFINNNIYEQLYYSNGTIINNCPAGTYLTNSGTCSSCDSSCLTCSGSSSNQCLTCPSNQVLVQGICQNSVTYISLTLKVTSNPTIVTLQLQPRAQILINALNTSTILSINNGAYTTYTYSFIDTGGTNINIQFSYSGYLASGALLWLNFTSSYLLDSQNKAVYYINPINLNATLLEFYPYSASELSTIQNNQQAISTTTTVSQVSTGVIAVSSSSSSTTFIVIQCISLFSMVRYLNLQYPPNAMMLFSQLQVQPVSLSFLPNIFNAIPIQKQDTELTAPSNFAFYNIQLYILGNFGGDLYQYLIMMIIAIIFLIISILPSKLPKGINGILSQIQNFLVWNYIFSFLISNYFNGVLFVFIQFANMPNNTPYQLANYIINIIFTLYLAFPLLTFWITLRHYKSLDNNEKQSPLPQYGSLLGDFKHDYLIQIMYPTLYMIRGFIAFGMLVWEMNSPLIIVIIWIILCSVILGILIIFRPYITRRNNLLNIGCELFNLAIYIVVLVLILTNINEVNTRNLIGFIILYLNTALYLWITIFSTYDMLTILWKIINLIKEKRAEQARLKYKHDIEMINKSIDNSNQTFNITKRLSSKFEDDNIPIHEGQIMDTSIIITTLRDKNEQYREEYVSSANDPRLKSITSVLKLRKFYKDKQNSSISTVILHKSLSLEYLDLLLEDEILENDDLAVISTSLIACKKLSKLKLNLSHNNINNNGIIHLFNTLMHLKNLKELNINLAYNQINNEGIDNLADTLTCLDQLIDLRINMSSNEELFKSNIFNKLSEALEKLNLLEIVHIQFDSLNLGEEIIPLMNSISKLNLINLQISLADNNINSNDLINICDHYLSRLTRLTSFGLSLNQNPIKSPGFEALGSLIKGYTTLKELKLDLASTYLNSQNMQILALDISQISSIISLDLDLSQNNFYLKGIEFLKELVNLENLTLNLTECNIKNENLETLCQMISNIPKLKILSIILTKNHIDETGRNLINHTVSKKLQLSNVSIAFA